MSEKVKMYPCQDDKMTKGYKGNDVLQNSWNPVAELFEFVEDGTYLSIYSFFQSKLH